MTTLNEYMHGQRRYEVVAPVVVADAPTSQGGQKYVYRHGILPADTSPAQIEKLLEMGLIRESQAVTL